MKRLVGTTDCAKIVMFERRDGKQYFANEVDLKPCEFIVKLDLKELKTLYETLNIEFPEP